MGLEMRNKSTTIPAHVEIDIIPALERRTGLKCFVQKYTSEGDGNFENAGYGEWDCLETAKNLASKKTSLAARVGFADDGRFGDFVFQIYEGGECMSQEESRDLYEGRGAHTAYEIAVHNEFYR